MPLSTSSSERASGIPPAPDRHPMSSRTGIATLLTGLALILLGLELSSPLILNRLSRIERRVENETQAAHTLRPFTPAGRAASWFRFCFFCFGDGGSEGLLFWGKNLSAKYAVSRLAIEQTHYLDW